MSKRVSNKKGKHKGARCKGVHIGYQRKHLLETLQSNQAKILKSEEKSEETITLLTQLRKQIIKLIPKRIHRHQGR